MTAGEFLKTARDEMQAAGNPDAVWDAEILLCEALGCEKSRLRFRLEEKLTEDGLQRLEKWLARRISGEPLAYVLGNTYFMGLRFLCDPRALIPRQDTETLAEEAIRALAGKSRPRVLDLCCGTGCVGLSIAKYVPGAQLTLSDLSTDALSLAGENARALGVAADLRQGDLFETVRGETFDLIACNPPYLTGQDMTELQTEVRREPALALFGGEDGLAFYRRLANEAWAYLNPGGALLAECGRGQAGDVARLFQAIGETRIVRDLCNIDRVIQVGSADSHLLPVSSADCHLLPRILSTTVGRH